MQPSLPLLVFTQWRLTLRFNHSVLNEGFQVLMFMALILQKNVFLLEMNSTVLCYLQYLGC